MDLRCKRLRMPVVPASQRSLTATPQRPWTAHMGRGLGDV